jgi:hypothetical protein
LVLYDQKTLHGDGNAASPIPACDAPTLRRWRSLARPREAPGGPGSGLSHLQGSRIPGHLAFGYSCCASLLASPLSSPTALCDERPRVNAPKGEPLHRIQDPAHYVLLRCAPSPSCRIQLRHSRWEACVRQKMRISLHPPGPAIGIGACARCLSRDSIASSDLVSSTAQAGQSPGQWDAPRSLASSPINKIGKSTDLASIMPSAQSASCVWREEEGGGKPASGIFLHSRASLTKTPLAAHLNFPGAGGRTRSSMSELQLESR